MQLGIMSIELSFWCGLFDTAHNVSRAHCSYWSIHSREAIPAVEEVDIAAMAGREPGLCLVEAEAYCHSADEPTFELTKHDNTKNGLCSTPTSFSLTLVMASSRQVEEVYQAHAQSVDSPQYQDQYSIWTTCLDGIARDERERVLGMREHNLLEWLQSRALQRHGVVHMQVDLL